MCDIRSITLGVDGCLCVPLDRRQDHESKLQCQSLGECNFFSFGEVLHEGSALHIGHCYSDIPPDSVAH